MDKFELNKKGVGELLKSAGMVSVCLSHANRLAGRDSGPHVVSTHIGKSRCNAEVKLTGKDVAERKKGMTNG